MKNIKTDTDLGKNWSKIANFEYFLIINSNTFVSLYLQSLLDLKNKNSNIIIADIYDEQAGVVLCEAYKLKVTF